VQPSRMHCAIRKDTDWPVRDLVTEGSRFGVGECTHDRKNGSCCHYFCWDPRSIEIVPDRLQDGNSIVIQNTPNITLARHILDVGRNKCVPPDIIHLTTSGKVRVCILVFSTSVLGLGRWGGHFYLDDTL
jgi:hypothetical protein